MKTRTNKMNMMIGLFALLTATIVLSLAAAPAMAGTPHLDKSKVLEMLHASDQDRLSEVLDSGLVFELVPGAIEDALNDDEPIPDGGGWEPVFPEDDADDAVPSDDADEAGDEAIEEAADHASDEAVDEASDETVIEDAGGDTAQETVDEIVDQDGDETTTEEAVDESTTQEEPQDQDDAVELPFTGGNSTPWLIAGAAIVFAGITLFFGRRKRNESR